MVWTSKNLSNGRTELLESDNSLSPILDYFNNPYFRTKLNGSCLTRDRLFTPNKKKIVSCL